MNSFVNVSEALNLPKFDFIHFLYYFLFSISPFTSLLFASYLFLPFLRSSLYLLPFSSSLLFSIHFFLPSFIPICFHLVKYFVKYFLIFWGSVCVRAIILCLSHTFSLFIFPACPISNPSPSTFAPRLIFTLLCFLPIDVNLLPISP